MKSKLAAALVVAGLMALTGYAFGQKQAEADKPDPPDPAVLQSIFGAFGGGLPEKWDRAWVVVSEAQQEGAARDFVVACLYTGPDGKSEGEPIPSCDRKTVFEKVYSLNRNLPTREKQRWKSATLLFHADGKFELSYEYADDADPKPKAKEKN